MDKQKKIIRYRIPVSVKFPATHPRAGEPTDFVKLILTFGKRHTIRGGKSKTGKCSYESWAKRFEKILKGDAVLELYYWTGKPYASKAVTICQFGKEDGIGIQKLTFEEMVMCPSVECFEVAEKAKGGGHIRIYRPKVGETIIRPETLSKNDGLTLKDFKSWFKGYDLSEPFAIIHFTSFRY